MEESFFVVFPGLELSCLSVIKLVKKIKPTGSLFERLQYEQTSIHKQKLMTKKEFLERASRILSELLKDEFKKIKKPIYLTWLPSKAAGFWNRLFSDPTAEAFWFSAKKVLEAFPEIDKAQEHKKQIAVLQKVEIVVFNPKAKHILRFSDEDLRELLRHELLHIELQKGHDKQFLNEALKRDIFVHTRDILANIESVDLNRAVHYLEDLR
jgi:hypothetical protein